MISKPLGIGVDVGVPIGDAVYAVCFSPLVPIPWMGPIWGPIGQVIYWISVVLPSQDPRAFFGMPGSTQVVNQTFSGLAPIKIPYDHLTDFYRYSWGLGETVRLSSPSAGGNLIGENQVVHTTVHGNVRPAGTGLYTYKNGVTWNIAGLNIEMPDQHSGSGYLTKYQMDGYSYPHDLGYGHAIHSTNLVGCPLMFSRIPAILAKLDKDKALSSAPYLPNTGGSTVIMVGDGSGMGFSDPKCGENSIEFMHHTFAYGAYWRQTKVHISFHINPVDNPGIFTPGGQPIYRVDVQASMDATLYGYNYPGRPGWQIMPDPALVSVKSTFNTNSTPLNCFMATDVFECKEGTMLELFSSGSVTLHGYEDIVREHLHSFRPSSQYSTNMALKSLRESSANWVETLAEIEENLSLFPKDEYESIITDLATFSSAYREKGAVSWILRKLAKILAGHVLLHGFAWSPNGSAASQLEHDLKGIANTLESNSDRVIVHGSGFFPDLKDIHPRPTRFTVRTKASIGGFDNPNVARILGLDRFGVLPTGERIWATTKYSWLIDTFVNIGARLNSLDTYVLLACLDASNFVHSYTFEFDLPDWYLLQMGVESSSANPPFVRVYIREVSKWIPALFAAEHAEAFIPDKRLTLAIAIALVAQMFISVPIDLAYGAAPSSRPH